MGALLDTVRNRMLAARLAPANSRRAWPRGRVAAATPQARVVDAACSALGWLLSGASAAQHMGIPGAYVLGRGWARPDIRATGLTLERMPRWLDLADEGRLEKAALRLGGWLHGQVRSALARGSREPPVPWAQALSGLWEAGVWLGVADWCDAAREAAEALSLRAPADLAGPQVARCLLPMMLGGPHESCLREALDTAEEVVGDPSHGGLALTRTVANARAMIECAEVLGLPALARVGVETADALLRRFEITRTLSSPRREPVCTEASAAAADLWGARWEEEADPRWLNAVLGMNDALRQVSAGPDAGHHEGALPSCIPCWSGPTPNALSTIATVEALSSFLREARALALVESRVAGLDGG